MSTSARQHQAFYEFLVPLVKGCSTEMSIEVASLGVQVHGGMGFIEETGAAQYLRDARILTIYEGTTAIQANDLVGRKTARDGGRVAAAIAGQHRRDRSRPGAEQQRRRALDAKAPRRRPRRRSSRSSSTSSAQSKSDPNAAFAGSVPYLMLAGNLVAGWQMARSLIAAERMLATGEGDAALSRRQGRDRALLRRAPAEPSAGAARRDRRGRRERHRDGARRVLIPTSTEESDAAARPSCATCPCRSSARRSSSSATRSW